MEREYIEQCIHQLDAMIATFQQATVIGGRTEKESQACELLKDARLKLIEDQEDQKADFEARMARQAAQFDEDKNHFTSWGLHADE